MYLLYLLDDNGADLRRVLFKFSGRCCCHFNDAPFIAIKGIFEILLERSEFLHYSFWYDPTLFETYTQTQVQKNWTLKSNKNSLLLTPKKIRRLCKHYSTLKWKFWSIIFIVLIFSLVNSFSSSLIWKSSWIFLYLFLLFSFKKISPFLYK